MTTLRQAAIAVIERWDAPMWRDLPATGKHIAALRKALKAPEQESVAAPDIKAMQANGKGPAPCARFCEANAFQNAIRQAEQGSQVLQAKCDAFFANTLLALKEIDDLTKERDEYRTAADSMATAHKTERDALLLANLDLKDWFDAIKSDYDTMTAAAKLALEALAVAYPADRSKLPAHNAAIAALKSAGVQ